MKIINKLMKILNIRSKKDRMIINLTRDLSGKRAVESMIMLYNYVPNYFFTMPSSTSGKYHPPDEFRKGGLVLHTLRVIEVVKMFCDMYEIGGRERDDLIQAAIFHDTFKCGSHGTGRTISSHPLLPGQNLDLSTEVASLIRTHSGRFYEFVKYEWSRASEHQQILHAADYIASRRNVKVNI